jgi:hypothetical protein
MMTAVRFVIASLLVLSCAACAERPIFGIELGSQRVQDCAPGNASRSCDFWK